MRVSVFGLGYVGAVTAGCLADDGHEVIGADVQPEKVQAFNDGISPIVEPGLTELLRNAKQAGRLRATLDPREAVQLTDVSIVCVGTPPLASGRLNLTFVRHVSSQIREALDQTDKQHVLIFRSTMLPGSTRSLIRDFFEPLQGVGRVRVYYCPEFLREGTAIADFREPSLGVVGTHDGSLGPRDEIQGLLGGTPCVLGYEAAELIKYSCNYFHALKVSFANEVGRLCKFLGEDGRQVMQVLCADTTLNISSHYMRPGNPFGGSCLPKDVSALRSFARQEGISLPLLEHTLESNQAHLDQLIGLIAGKKKHRIGLLGLTFKTNTDDLRGSPMVAVAETLLGRGYQLRIYDPQLRLARLIGANADEIQRRMPHLASLLGSTAQDVVQDSDVIVASQKVSSLEVLAPAARPDQSLIDAAGWPELAGLPWQYEGVCW